MKNYQHASEDEILEHAKTLEGLSFAQIVALNSQTHQRNCRNRGDQGNFIETFAFFMGNALVVRVVEKLGESLLSFHNN